MTGRVRRLLPVRLHETLRRGKVDLERHAALDVVGRYRSAMMLDRDMPEDFTRAVA